VTLTDNEGYVILAAIVTALLVGFVTRRSAVALLPLLGLGTFLAYAWTSDDRYSRIPEDVQATVTVALLFSSVLAIVGVLLRRIVDSERLHRRSRRQLE
jgi:uncharacterized membrane protein YcfT